MDQQHFVTELAKLRSSSTFLSLISYKNEQEEVSNYNIVFHMSYKNALEKSIMILHDYIPENDLEAKAKVELLESFSTSVNKIQTTSIEDLDDGYTRFFDEDKKYIKGVKLHNESGALHLYGLVVNKKVITPGVYSKKNKRPLTIAKDKLRKMLPVNKFRQFIIKPGQLEKISVENMTLLPPV